MFDRKTTHDNHYVSQGLMRNWSVDGARIQAYRLLVSNANVPEWSSRAIKGTAFLPNLYTSSTTVDEADQFERWLAREFEDPGLEAVAKLVGRGHLQPADWRSLARFVAAQDVRTPLNYIESMERWDTQVPQILEETIPAAIDKFRSAKPAGIPVTSKSELEGFKKAFRVKINPPVDETSYDASLQVEALMGRELWIESMRHLLRKRADVLCQHRWSVAQPNGNEEWILTDHPVLRLNYYDPNRYDFRGGWANPGSEIIMPISPRHLLYVQVGQKHPNRFVFGASETRLVQRMLAERALRWIFARQPLAWVERVRPRMIDPVRFQAEEGEFEKWHREQSEAELEFRESTKDAAKT